MTLHPRNGFHFLNQQVIQLITLLSLAAEAAGLRLIRRAAGQAVAVAALVVWLQPQV
jgi:hypothetical protein